MSQEEAIVIEKVSKAFGKRVVVDDITLRIPRGKVYALMGPNGAGKTTLLKMMVGLLEPTTGTITHGGFSLHNDPITAKKQFGFVSDNPSGYSFLTGREFLAFSGKLRGFSASTIETKIAELLPIFPLADIIDSPMEEYSRGNIEKVVFLATILSQPPILIIDEPIVGLDPDSIMEFGKQLQKYAREGNTVLFTTHILSFAKEYADLCGIIAHGKFVHQEAITSKTHLDALYERYTKNT